jgi:hypothetical protein
VIGRVLGSRTAARWVSIWGLGLRAVSLYPL